MPKSISVGYTDTAISGVTTLPFSRGLVNYGANFREKSVTPTEVVLTNITSPVDAPETFRFACTDVKNIYTGTSIDAAQMSPAKAGVSLLCELKDTISVTDPDNTDLDLRLPISYHVVIKIPRTGDITSEMIMTGLGRLVSGLFDTGSTTTTRLDAMIRGSLVPSDL